jgi:ABC-type multidrug transport system ATPase subunit
MEMVGKPSILLLDEPTSGLDATSSLQLVKALRATAQQGICVAAVLHQPRYEMFCLFHDVLLLGKGGFTVYLGKLCPSNILSQFAC